MHYDRNIRVTAIVAKPPWVYKSLQLPAERVRTAGGRGRCELDADDSLDEFFIGGGLQVGDLGLAAAEIGVQRHRGDLFLVDKGVHGALLAGAQHGLGTGRGFAGGTFAQVAAILCPHVGLLGDAEEHHILSH